MISLNSNAMSMHVERQLARATRGVSRAFEALSSGLRINRPSDDAAGLAIASHLGLDRRVYTQAVRNVNDALSLYNIADGALGELSTVVIRIRELSTQAANGTLTITQRRALDAEADLLVSEFNRIAGTTAFNGRALLDATFAELAVQAGYSTVALTLAEELARLAGDGTFQTAESFGVADNPWSVTTGDFNGDGVLDLVTADLSDNTVGVHLGNGDGTFQAAAAFGVGSLPQSVTTGDFNGDGVLDLATANLGDNTVSVLLGNGDGTFQAAAPFGVGDLPESVTTGDFNGDGVLDLATANPGDNTVSVLLGNGDGTFHAAAAFGVGDQPQSVTTGDFNGDGVLDIATADRAAGAVNVLLGNGDGTFQAAAAFGVGSQPVSVTTGDFNDDGVLDLATADLVGDTVSVLLGNGDGTFQAAVAFSVGDQPRSITIGDFNGDGILDLATADRGDDAVSVLVGNGDGTFQAAVAFGVGDQPWSITTGDFNGDGVLDIATAEIADNSISVLRAHTALTTTLPTLNINTQAGALGAMTTVDAALQRLTAERGNIGSAQSRLRSVMNNLEHTSVAYADAESRIMDVDIARESAQLVRNGILQEAGAALLAQANQAPGLALLLLS